MQTRPDILTSEQAQEAMLCWGMGMTQESLVIHRLASTVIALYKELQKRPLGLDRETIAQAINSELDWLELDQCRYAAAVAIHKIIEENNGL